MSYYEQYKNYEIPHIHRYEDVLRNTWEDALEFQGLMIKTNLERKFPDATYEDIREMMFGERED